MYLVRAAVVHDTEAEHLGDLARVRDRVIGDGLGLGSVVRVRVRVRVSGKG